MCGSLQITVFSTRASYMRGEVKVIHGLVSIDRCAEARQ